MATILDICSDALPAASSGTASSGAPYVPGAYIWAFSTFLTDSHVPVSSYGAGEWYFAKGAVDAVLGLCDWALVPAGAQGSSGSKAAVLMAHGHGQGQGQGQHTPAGGHC
jgi:hypothetical protein